MADDESRFRYLGGGGSLALEVTGPTVESCLARAVEAVGNAIAVVHPSVPTRRVAVAVEGDSPAELLQRLLDAAVRRVTTHGEVPLGLAGACCEGRQLVATLSVVPLAAARPPVAAPVPTWHGVDLHHNGRGWHGLVRADL